MTKKFASEVNSRKSRILLVVKISQFLVCICSVLPSLRFPTFSPDCTPLLCTHATPTVHPCSALMQPLLYTPALHSYSPYCTPLLCTHATPTVHPCSALMQPLLYTPALHSCRPYCTPLLCTHGAPSVHPCSALMGRATLNCS